MSDPDSRKHITVFHRTAPVNERLTLVFWLLVALAAMLAAVLISARLERHAGEYLAICLLLALGFVTVPAAVQTGYAIFREWSAGAGHFARQDNPDIDDWLHAQFAFLCGNRTMDAWGLGLGLAAVAAFAHGLYFEGYPFIARAFLASVMFGSAAFAGMGIYAMLCASLTIWRLGNLEQLSLVVHEHRFGVLSVGRALFRAWLMIGLIWAIYVATAFVGYTGQNFSEIITLAPMYLLALPTLPLIVGSFVICQIPLHRRMIAYKQSEVQRLDRMLETLQPAGVDELDGERRQNIAFLEQQKAQLRGLPDWPFNTSSLIGTGASSLTALLPVFAGKFFPDWVNDFIKAIF